MTWQPNIHASLFLNMHEYLNKVAEIDEIDTVIKAYQLYLEQIQAQGLEPLLSVTRAWRLVKFVDNGMLTLTKCCSRCGGHFVTHPHEIARHYVCGLCKPPARAGKGRMAGALRAAAEAEAIQAEAEAGEEHGALMNEFTPEIATRMRAAAARAKVSSRQADNPARVV
jgi:flagellar transcriptional activator FlhC